MSDVFNRMDNSDTRIELPIFTTPANICDSWTEEITRHGTFEEVIWKGRPNADAGGWSTNAVSMLGEKRRLRRGGATAVDESAPVETSDEPGPSDNSYVEEFNRNITIRLAKLRKIASEVSESQDEVQQALLGGLIDRCKNRRI